METTFLTILDRLNSLELKIDRLQSSLTPPHTQPEEKDSCDTFVPHPYEVIRSTYLANLTEDQRESLHGQYVGVYDGAIVLFKEYDAVVDFADKTKTNPSSFVCHPFINSKTGVQGLCKMAGTQPEIRHTQKEDFIARMKRMNIIQPVQDLQLDIFDVSPPHAKTWLLAEERKYIEAYILAQDNKI
jgi:hypothetical protein